MPRGLDEFVSYWKPDLCVTISINKSNRCCRKCKKITVLSLVTLWLKSCHNINRKTNILFCSAQLENMQNNKHKKGDNDKKKPQKPLKEIEHST